MFTNWQCAHSPIKQQHTPSRITDYKLTVCTFSHQSTAYTFQDNMVTNWQCSHSPIKPQHTPSRITGYKLTVCTFSHQATTHIYQISCSHKLIKTYLVCTYNSSCHHALLHVRLVLPNFIARSVTHDEDKLQKHSLSNFSHFPFYIYLILKYFPQPLSKSSLRFPMTEMKYYRQYYNTSQLFAPEIFQRSWLFFQLVQKAAGFYGNKRFSTLFVILGKQS